MVLKQKRALSPVITTVLLVMVAIVLAVIILLWAKGIIKEKTMKFEEPIDRACEGLQMQFALVDGKVSFTNQGDTPIYRIDISKTSAGSSDIIKSTTTNLYQGFSGILEHSSTFSSSDNLKIVPVLLGQKENSKEIQEYTCPNNYWRTVE